MSSPFGGQPAASSLPTGQNGLGTAQTPGGGTPVTGSATWLPPFRLGQGLTGVFADALGLIAGEPATATTANIGGTVNTQSSTGSGSDSGNTAAGSGGPSGGTASSMDTGGNSSSGPAPKATSQAQRDANNAAASAAYPGYKGAG